MLNPTSPLPAARTPRCSVRPTASTASGCEADSGKTHRREEPGHRRGDRRGPRDGRRRNPPRHRGRQPRAAGLARHAGQGARRDPAQAVRPDDGEHRRPGRHHDRRAGQAAGREQGRDRLCRQLHRVVRRRGQAHLRRHHPAERQGPPHHRDEGADRRVRRDHAVELPGRDDHPQGRPRLGRRLHRRDPPGQPDAVLRPGARRAGRARRHAAGRVQRHHRPIRRDRRASSPPTRWCAS